MSCVRIAVEFGGQRKVGNMDRDNEASLWFDSLGIQERKDLFARLKKHGVLMSELPDICIKELRSRVKELESERDALKKEADEAKAEIADTLQFLRNEMDWEYFRADMLYSKKDDEEKQKASEENARIISNRLKETGHGIAFLKQFDAKTAECDKYKAACFAIRDYKTAEEESAAYDLVRESAGIKP